MLERHERELVEPVVISQVREKASEPGVASLGIGPYLDIFSDALEDRPTKLQLRIDAMDRRGPLQVESCVVFRYHVLTIGLLAHLHLQDGIFASLKVGDLGRGILGRAVSHRNRNDSRQTARNAAG